MSFFRKMLGRFCRSPDIIIGGSDNPYLLRWHVIPRNRFFNIYLHKFLRDDDDRALHDHPWASCSILLKGGYWEHLPGGVKLIRRVGGIYFRRATQAHRIQLFGDDNCRDFVTRVPAWSLFVTGPKVREWGFLCSKGWVHWKIFCSPADTNVPEYGLIGRGCE